MAAVAEPPTGAREVLVYPDSPVKQQSSSSSPAPGRGPRCEAFVMTGDKILNLDHHISPSYAKAVSGQLPPLTHIQEPSNRTPLSEFPSVRRSMRSRLPVSVSQPDSMTKRQMSCPEKENEQEEPESSAADRALPPPIENGEYIKDVQMESSMHSSYYKSAFSNPQLSSQRTTSGATFVISPSDSPMKNSTVTVNATNCAPSVSATASPSLRRVLGTRTREDFGSFRSDTSGLVSREEKEATRVAVHLFKLEGFSKTDVTTRLNDVGEFASLVTTKYLELFNFSGIRIDAALRDFLARVELRGESSQRERLLRFFSARYHEANPSLFNTVDEVHTLTCALLLLNSDLHGPNNGKKMTMREFVNNIAHTGVELKRDLLKTLYSSIKESAISHNKEIEKKSLTVKSFSSRQVLRDIDPESQVQYKCGWLMRKCLYDSDGAKTPVGRRGWSMWFGRLRGLVLYLSRDEGDIKSNKFETFNNSILLHHSFAEPALDYAKRQHTFRIRTANLGEYLFQTSNTSEVDEWITMLNFASAAFSSKSMPPPTGSQFTFARARLPKMTSLAPLSQQLKSHESAADELRRQLSRVQDDAPPLRGSRGRCVKEFFFRERYLTQEIKRYEEYSNLLRKRLAPEGSESTSGVHSKSDIVDEDKMSYKEAMHH